MKVKLEDGYRSRYTLEDIDRAKAVIENLKGDESTAKEYAEYAAREALKAFTAHTGHADSVKEIYRAEAYTARNCRAWNAYDEGTYDMDVWIEFTARTYEGFIEGGAYLTDIWQTGAEDYSKHMFSQYFTRK